MNKIIVMKKTLHINTILDQPGLLENLVEKLACRRYDIGYSLAIVPKNLKAIEVSSTETFVSGTMAISGKKDQFNMPFITRFLFTCTKAKGSSYKLAWYTSLS